MDDVKGAGFKHVDVVLYAPESTLFFPSYFILQHGPTALIIIPFFFFVFIYILNLKLDNVNKIPYS